MSPLENYNHEIKDWCCIQAFRYHSFFHKTFKTNIFHKFKYMCMYTHVQMLCWIILQNILITWMCCPLIWWVENEIGFSHVFNIHRHRQLLCKLRQNVLYDYMINVSKWYYLWWLCVILVSCVGLQEPLYKIFSKISSVFSMPRYVFPVF